MRNSDVELPCIDDMKKNFSTEQEIEMNLTNYKDNKKNIIEKNKNNIDNSNNNIYIPDKSCFQNCDNIYSSNNNYFNDKNNYYSFRQNINKNINDKIISILSERRKEKKNS